MSWSKEAEQSLLGALLLDDLAYDAISGVGINAGDFMADQHRVIFEAIDSVCSSGQAVDILSVCESLRPSGKLDQAGGPEYVSYLIDITPSAENVLTYAKIVKEHSRKRQLMALSDGIQIRIGEGDTTEAVIDYVGEASLSVSEGGDKSTAYTAGRALKNFAERLQERQSGILKNYPTGLTDLDDMIRMSPGNLVIVAARPAMGKSTLGQVIAEANLKAGTPVLHFTMEMPNDQLISRYVASVGSVSRSFMTDPAGYKGSDDEWRKVLAASTVIKDWPLTIEDKSGPTVGDIRNKSRAFFRKQEAYKDHGKGLIVIDQLTLMKYEGTNRVHALGGITKALKSLALELGIPVVLLTQLNRSLEQRPNKRPMNSDLRDSGEIEEDADTIVFIYRDEVYNEDSDDKGVAELIVGKAREGRTGTARVLSQLEYSRFRNFAPQYSEQ
jgi:replicative DNA helicase